MTLTRDRIYELKSMGIRVTFEELEALCDMALNWLAVQPSEENTVYIVFQNEGIYDSIIHDTEDDAWCDLEKMTDEPREALQLDGFEVKAFTLTYLPEPKA